MLSLDFVGCDYMIEIEEHLLRRRWRFKSIDQTVRQSKSRDFGGAPKLDERRSEVCGWFKVIKDQCLRLERFEKTGFDDIPPLGDEVVEGKRKFTQSVLHAGLHKSAVQAYLATTAYVDAQHGRVLDTLAKSPYRDNTIVIFLSDHGFHLAEKDHWQKGTLWEEATNSMLLFRVPGVTEPGGSTTRCVSLQDLYPTLLDLCEIPRPDHLDGKSLVPILEDPEVDWESTAISYLYDRYASIRTEQFRYIRYQNGQEELYDHERDPREWKNEASNPEYAKVFKELADRLPSIAEMASQIVRD